MSPNSLPVSWRLPATRRPGPFPAAALATALLLSACGTRQPAPTAPAPAVVEREELGESAEILEAKVASVRRDILGGLAYDLPVEANSWVEAELDFLVGQRKSVIGRWIERGDHYEEFIKRVLRENKLPTDLYHLAMIESGFVPTVRSRAGAVGMWQFMPSTARAVGLRVDTLVDERMDPVRSTRAAVRHLRSVHKEMRGDWALTAAAYNAGTGRISRGLRQFGVSTYWDLAQRGDLAEETKLYVPRLYAMTVIARGRERFGFAPRPDAPGFRFDSIHVEYATPLSELARLTPVGEEELARLNPHLLRRTTPEGGYWVWVVGGTGEEMQRAYLASDFRRLKGLGSYTVRHGDHLGKLADLGELEAARIRELNPRVDFDNLRSGQKLRLPSTVARELAARPADEEERAYLAAASKAKKKPSARKAKADESADGDQPEKKAAAEPAARSHEVKDGETLWELARKYDVTVEEIRSLNDLSGSTIVPGKRLKIPGAEKPAAKGSEKAEKLASAETSEKPAKSEKSEKAAAAETPAKSGKSATARPEKAEKEKERKASGAKKPKTAQHVVQSGDTLWGIAREYDSTVEAIQDANELGDRPIKPGQKLKIPAKG